MTASRYSRQELFAGIGREGQARLGKARVVVVGCGALGSVASEMMVRAGAASVTVNDRDFVEESNLQRQSLFDEADVALGMPKAAAAEAHLRALNSDVTVRGIVTDFVADNADALAAAGLGDRVAIDLGEVRGLDYYTGLVFRVYARGLGFEVGGGGRYDTLLARFGRPMPAVGFMLGLDRVALLLERQQAPAAEEGAPAEPIANAGLGASLKQARARRAAGARVRFGGEAR